MRKLDRRQNKILELKFKGISRIPKNKSVLKKIAKRKGKLDRREK